MDIKDMKELIRAVSESDITNFEYEDDTQEIRIKKDTVQNLVTVQPNEDRKSTRLNSSHA